MEIDWGIIITIGSTILSVVMGLWGVWYFYAIPKLRYKIDIMPFLVNLRHSNHIKRKLKILYDEKLINELSIVCITICNKGRGIAENFIAPIKIRCNLQILDVYPNQATVNSKIITEYSISKDNRTVSITPNYINQNESMVFYFVVDGTNSVDIQIEGRCKGCSRISPFFMEFLQVLFNGKLAHWLFIISILFFIVAASFELKNRLAQMKYKLAIENESICQQINKIKNTQNLMSEKDRKDN